MKKKVSISKDVVNYYLLALDTAKQAGIVVGPDELYEISMQLGVVDPKVFGPVIAVMLIHGLMDVRKSKNKMGLIAGRGKTISEKAAQQKLCRAISHWKETVCKKK